MFGGVFMAYSFVIGRKFYQLDIDASFDEDILKDSNCVFGIFLKPIPKHRNFFRYYRRFLIVGLNKMGKIETK
jgi:hypothetical protein